MLSYYLVTAIVTLISFALLISVFEPNRISCFVLALMAMLLMANLGYLSIALSTQLNEAILATKIIYVAGSFFPPLFLMFTCELCGWKIPGWLRALLYLSSFALFAMALSIGFSDLYYSDVQLFTEHGVTVLKRSYGPGHLFAYPIRYGNIIATIVLLLYTGAKKRTISTKKVYSLLAVVLANSLFFVIARLLGSDFQVMPLTYMVDSLILLAIYHQGIAYSIDENIQASFGKQELYGFVMLDENFNYVGCNSIAHNMLPALPDCTIDKPIDGVLGMEQVLEWLAEFTSGGKADFSYEIADQHFECRIEKVFRRSRFCGYMMELREDTDRWKYMDLLASHNFELKKIRMDLEETVSQQTDQLRHQNENIEELFIQTVTALSEAVDAKDSYTCGHSRRVAKYAGMIAKRMGKTEDEAVEIYYAGLLHDVGKIKIADNIINKMGRLTNEEYNIIKIHPTTGYYILRGISNSSLIAIGAKHHHERYDGNGYPSGLVGKNIPEVARILGVADAYDAMTSNRSYRKALPQDIVREEIAKGSGVQFDPEITEIMLHIIDEDTEYHLRQDDSDSKKILVFDSEEDSARTIAQIIHDDPNYEVIPAYEPQEALTMLKSQPFNLILLGVSMLESFGADPSITVRRLRFKYRVPIVLMTDDQEQQIPIELSSLGCEDFIAKPFLPPLVREVIYNMTKRTDE